SMGGAYPWWKYWQRPEPTMKDLKEIQKRSTASESSTFIVEVSRTVKYQNNSIENTEI
ncbi:MAG: ABC transporter permease, partial [Bacteroidetes bacterium]|nr:ABC transporter permease [Bacteroidota bacterium]